MVRPGGRIVLLEFLRPEKPRLFFDRVYNAHVLPLLGWMVSGDRDAYRYLPDSIAPLPLAARSWPRCWARSASRTVETKALFPSGVATMVVAS